MQVRTILIIVVFVPKLLLGTTFFVTSSGSGTQDGSSWTNSISGNNVQATINTAVPGDQVWIGCGTYFPTTGTNRSISFSMKIGVEIYGGFQGNESLLSERQLACGSCSILSGEIGASGIADNSYKVVYNSTMDSTAVLDGFIIRDGNDNRNPSNTGNGLGAGVYNHGFGSQGHSDPTIRNCIVTNNQASFGAGVFNNGYNNGNTEPTFINCIFHKNHATLEAGGMDSYGVGGNASPLLINCIFYENTSATNVGAMYAWGGSQGGNSHPVLINCVFANNVAQNGYGGAFIADNHDQVGGGSSGSCSVTLSNCIVWNNSASSSDPQFTVRGTGAQVVATYSNIDMTNQSAPSILSGVGTANLNTNPLFINVDDALGIDNCWLSNDDGLRLSGSSASVNSGTAHTFYSFDITGQVNRSLENATDMGAYEYNPIVTNEINKKESINQLALMPNPVNELLRVSGIDLTSSPIIIYNKLGQIQNEQVKIVSSTEFTVTVDVAKLGAGIYFLQNGDRTAKFLVR